MRRRLLLILALITTASISKGQDSLTFYYNHRYEAVRPDSATIIRKAIIKDKLMFARDYYKGVVLLEEGSYYLTDTTREGHFIIYHTKGGKKKEGNYAQDVKVGKWTYWYEDGTVESEQIYLEDADLIAKLIKKDSHIKQLFKRQPSGRILGFDGIRTGVNVWYYENGQKSSEEFYTNGKITKARYWNEQGEEVKADIKDDYDNEMFPRMINDDAQSFLARNIVYPKEALKANVSGRVVIQFKVKKNGLLEDFHVVKSSGNQAIDDEGMRVIRMMNGKFTPKVSHNRRQDVNYTIPVGFRINRN